MRVLFISPYPVEGASTRYRVSQFFPYLESKGILCELRPFFSVPFFRTLYQKGKSFRKGIYFFKSCLGRVRDFFHGLRADIIFVHLEAFPFGPPFMEWAWSRCGKRLVYDLDDAIYMGHSSEVNRRFLWLKWSSKVPKIIRLSREVIACNEYLASYAKQFNTHVHVLSTSVDTTRFKPVSSRDPNRKLVIGWIGSHSTSPYLDSLRGVFQRLSEKYSFVLKIVGAGREIVFPGVEMVERPWSLESDIQEFEELDIGIYPLPETEWVLGKTGFKTIQYLSMGIPCVVSRVGRNVDIVRHGENGFLAKTEQDWIETLSRLIENHDLRERIGISGRRTALEYFSLEQSAPQLETILRKAHGDLFQHKKYPIKVLHLITDLDVGGTPTALVSILEHTHRGAYDIHVCSLKRRTSISVADEIKKLGIPVYFLNAERLLFFVVPYRLMLLLRDLGVDLLHTWLFHANLFGRLAGRLEGVPTIISSERSVNQGKGLFRIWADRFTSTLANLIVVNAEAVRQTLVRREGISPSKISVIKSGVDLMKFSNGKVNGNLRSELGVDRKDFVISTVARLDPVKGHEDLLLAMQEVWKAIPSTRLLLVGGGPQKKHIERKIELLGMAEKVMMLGVRRDIPEILAISDLFVLPSWEEGMPLSLLEAMGMGKAVVATDVGGVREVIPNDSLGVVVPARDPERLGQAIMNLLRDAKKREEMGRNARHHIQNAFDVSRTVRELEKAYHQILL